MGGLQYHWTWYVTARIYESATFSAGFDCHRCVAGFCFVVVAAVRRTRGSRFRWRSGVSRSVCSKDCADVCATSRNITSRTQTVPGKLVQWSVMWNKSPLMKSFETRFVKSDSQLDVLACALVCIVESTHRTSWCWWRIWDFQQTCCLTIWMIWLDTLIFNRMLWRRTESCIVGQTIWNPTGVPASSDVSWCDKKASCSQAPWPERLVRTTGVCLETGCVTWKVEGPTVLRDRWFDIGWW